MDAIPHRVDLSVQPEVTGFFDAATNTISDVVKDPASNACAVIDSVMDIDYAAGRITYASADSLIAQIRDRGLALEWLIETHVHADHLSAAPYIQARLGGRIGIGQNITVVQEVFGKVFNEGTGFRRDGSQFDHLLKDGDSYLIGSMRAFALHTPGHTPACMTHVIGDAAVVGDTLFMPDGGLACADFPGGDARTLFRSMRRILQLPPATRLFMCHDYGPNCRDIKWQTTVAEERARNIHVRDGITEDEFVVLREARDRTLGMPRLRLCSVTASIVACAAARTSMSRIRPVAMSIATKPLPQARPTSAPPASAQPSISVTTTGRPTRNLVPATRSCRVTLTLRSSSERLIGSDMSLLPTIGGARGINSCGTPVSQAACWCVRGRRKCRPVASRCPAPGRAGRCGQRSMRAVRPGNRAATRPHAAADNGAPAPLRFHVSLRLAGRDVTHELRHVRAGEVLHAPRTEQRNDVALDAPLVSVDRRGPLRPLLLAEDQPGLRVGHIALAKLLDRDRAVVEFPLLCRVLALRDAAQEHAGFPPRRLRRPDAMHADRESPGAPLGAILYDVAAPSRGEHAQAEPGQFVIPDEVVRVFRRCLIDGALAELSHVLCSWSELGPVGSISGSTTAAPGPKLRRADGYAMRRAMPEKLDLRSGLEGHGVERESLAKSFRIRSEGRGRRFESFRVRQFFNYLDRSM
jgi:glyoxylase-like metal-dependent hydrolase (beta-lactamase superfamily II)